MCHFFCLLRPQDRSFPDRTVKRCGGLFIVTENRPFGKKNVSPEISRHHRLLLCTMKTYLFFVKNRSNLYVASRTAFFFWEFCSPTYNIERTRIKPGVMLPYYREQAEYSKSGGIRAVMLSPFTDGCCPPYRRVLSLLLTDVALLTPHRDVYCPLSSRDATAVHRRRQPAWKPSWSW